MDRPPPDPTKLLEAWMEWERGDTPPGRVISNLKTGGLRDLLEELSAAKDQTAGAAASDESAPAAPPDAAASESWTPVV